MKSIVTISGPREAGPGERELMLARAHELLGAADAGEITRIDVPGRGAGDDVSEAGMRVSVQPVVPALQS
ncbi:MAG: hypothetical protein ACE5GC_07210 [Acidimicrobiia bacterium]